MKFLMVSAAGEGSHILKMIEREGNDVELYIKIPEYRSVFDGLLSKAKKISPDKDTTVIFDYSGSGKMADQFRKSGIPVVGGSSFADRLEQDRAFGFEVMEQVGIKLPMMQEFKSSKGVAEFLAANDKYEEGECAGELRRFVYKPEGKDVASHLTYVSLDSEDLLRYVLYAEKSYGQQIDSFILQEFIEGVAVSSELWSDGSKFIRPGNHTLEVKGFMDGNRGSATGCSGNIVWAEHGACRIISDGVAKMEKITADNGHVGPMDLNAIVNDDGVWGLEWTPRFGYDSTPTEMFLMTGEIGKFFADLARGQAREMPLSDRLAAGVRFSIPPYPLEPKKASEIQKIRPNKGVPIRGITEKNQGSLYMYEVMEDADGELVHSDGTGLLGVAIGLGEQSWCLFDEPYCVLNQLKIPELQYRTDLGDVLGCMYAQTQEQDGVALGSLGREV